MRISLHGGACCGIKHIHGLGYDPSGRLKKMEKAAKADTSYDRLETGGLNDQAAHKATWGQYDFFPGPAPAETTGERFVRLLDFIKAKRPSGMVEVTLVRSQKPWVEVLEQHGFECVGMFRNCNTTAVVKVYRLVYGDPPSPHQVW